MSRKKEKKDDYFHDYCDELVDALCSGFGLTNLFVDLGDIWKGDEKDVKSKKDAS